MDTDKFNRFYSKIKKFVDVKQTEYKSEMWIKSSLSFHKKVVITNIHQEYDNRIQYTKNRLLNEMAHDVFILVFGNFKLEASRLIARAKMSERYLTDPEFTDLVNDIENLITNETL